MDYRDTRAYILDPCIQEFLESNGILLKRNTISAIYRLVCFVSAVICQNCFDKRHTKVISEITFDACV